MRNIFISSSPPSFTQSYGAGWKLWTFRVDIFSSFLSDSTSTYLLLSTFYWYWKGGWRELICVAVSVALSHYFSSQLTISAHPVCGLTTLIRLHWTEKNILSNIRVKIDNLSSKQKPRPHKGVVKRMTDVRNCFNEWRDSRPLNRSSISGGGDRRRSWRVVTSRDTAWRALQGVTRAYIYTPSSTVSPVGLILQILLCWIQFRHKQLQL